MVARWLDEARRVILGKSKTVSWEVNDLLNNVVCDESVVRSPHSGDKDRERVTCGYLFCGLT